jgi:antitoxin HicB
MDPTEVLKRPYARVLTPDPDGRVTAEIMEFPGCVAFGDTSTEALARLEEVAVDWINAAVEQGQAIPEPLSSIDYSGKLVLRMTKGLHHRAAIFADREGVSLNQFIVTCLAEAVGERARPVMGVNYQALLHTMATATFNYNFGGTSSSNISTFAMNTGTVQTGQISAATSNELIAFPPQHERKREYA